MAEIILIVDDEASVRKTFEEWLAGASLDAEILTAEDAAAALQIANRRTIDLAILDWNLGVGNDGLHLLEDLCLFNPDVVAILVTGYAHQATPLDAMRMGVRDYLDKNQDLHRDSFLAAVRKQLDRIRPAKRERQLQRGLTQFRDSVEKILPLVQTAAAINDPVPFTESVRSLFRFMQRNTGATDGVLVVRSYDGERQPPEIYQTYDMNGDRLEVALLPFSQSLASAVLSMQEPSVLADISHSAKKLGVQLQPFEQNRESILAAPMNLGPGLHVVLELMDKRPKFTDADRQFVAAAAEFAAEMLKQALAERQTHSLLFDAVASALEASRTVSESLTKADIEAPPPRPVMEQLRQSLERSPLEVVDGEQALALAEKVRVLAARHGKDAIQYCLEMLNGVDKLLRSATGINEK